MIFGQPQQPYPQPLGPAQDPRSQYLTDALKQIGQGPQGNVQGLAGNLLADALDQWSLKKRQAQLNAPDDTMSSGQVSV